MNQPAQHTKDGGPSGTSAAYERYVALVTRLEGLRDAVANGEAELEKSSAAEAARVSTANQRVDEVWTKLYDAVRETDASLLALADAATADVEHAAADERDLAGTVFDASSSFPERVAGVVTFGRVLRERFHAERQLKQLPGWNDPQLQAKALAAWKQQDGRLTQLRSGNLERASSGYSAVVEMLRTDWQHLRMLSNAAHSEEYAARAARQRTRIALIASGTFAAFLCVVVALGTKRAGDEQTALKAALASATESVNGKRYDEALERLGTVAKSWGALGGADRTTANRICATAVPWALASSLAASNWQRALDLTERRVAPCGSMRDTDMSQDLVDAVVSMPTVPVPLRKHVRDYLLAKKGRGVEESKCLDRLVAQIGGPLEVAGSGSREGVIRGVFSSDRYVFGVVATAAAWEPPNTLVLTVQFWLTGDLDEKNLPCAVTLRGPSSSSMQGVGQPCTQGDTEVEVGERHTQVYRFYTPYLDPLFEGAWSLVLFDYWPEGAPMAFSRFAPPPPKPEPVPVLAEKPKPRAAAPTKRSPPKTTGPAGPDPSASGCKSDADCRRGEHCESLDFARRPTNICKR